MSIVIDNKLSNIIENQLINFEISEKKLMLLISTWMTNYSRFEYNDFYENIPTIYEHNKG